METRIWKEQRGTYWLINVLWCRMIAKAITFCSKRFHCFFTNTPSNLAYRTKPQSFTRSSRDSKRIPRLSLRKQIAPSEILLGNIEPRRELLICLLDHFHLTSGSSFEAWIPSPVAWPGLLDGRRPSLLQVSHVKVLHFLLRLRIQIQSSTIVSHSIAGRRVWNRNQQWCPTSQPRFHRSGNWGSERLSN